MAIPSSSYSGLTGCVYIFNLIIGTGAFTLPKAFFDAGWILGTVILFILAFMSYLTASFIIESMACANAMLHWKRLKQLKSSTNGGYVNDNLFRAHIPNVAHNDPLEDSDRPGFPDEIEPLSENAPLLLGGPSTEDIVNIERSRVCEYYLISEIVELGKMASYFFSRFGRTLFYICITIYLYGDLAIYSTAIAKSLTDATCHPLPNITLLPTGQDIRDLPCRTDITRGEAYRISLIVFVCLVGPFAFFNVQKTKYLQIATTFMRWFAFISMIIIAIVRIAKKEWAPEPKPDPPVFRIQGLSNLIGVSVYSFMCHHSLPSLVTPISNKSKLNTLLALDYTLILGFYFLLAFTGIFAFNDLQELYTLNFPPNPNDGIFMEGVSYFLVLFPVLTLSTNYPIIAITLRNNLKALFLTEGRMYSWCTRSCVFPLLAIVPPLIVSLITDQLEDLVGITGSYAGVGIQYVIPGFLVYYARKVTTQTIGVGVKNPHGSFFKHTYWIIFVQLWALLCVAFVTWNNFSHL
ncbi:transmembrane protein 104 [Lepeophtheirus salmonis]|uniref:transmembrane protein 104 n=1 Tax=Lepeophtheirus salmonis TaxID=72036 RepID=UPI001AE4C2B9|nr:transmembrane protein 104-like [Lepeophtheirus salmonis]